MSYQIESAMVKVIDEETGMSHLLPMTFIVSDISQSDTEISELGNSLVILVGHVDLPKGDEEE